MARIKNYLNNPLIDKVVEEIKHDLAQDDITALCELLSFVPVKNLIAYLPEQYWDKFKQETNKNGSI